MQLYIYLFQALGNFCKVYALHFVFNCFIHRNPFLKALCSRTLQLTSAVCNYCPSCRYESFKTTSTMECILNFIDPNQFCRLMTFWLTNITSDVWNIEFLIRDIWYISCVEYKSTTFWKHVRSGNVTNQYAHTANIRICG